IESLGILGISIVPLMALVVALLTSFADRLQTQSALLDELWHRTPQQCARLPHESLAWLSQLLGAQGALLATAQLVHAVPVMDAKPLRFVAGDGRDAP